MGDAGGMSVVDVPDEHRFELREGDDTIGFAAYRPSERGVILPHTEIAPHRRGQGNSQILIRGVLEVMRERGEKVIPRCWAVAEFIEQHPEYADLVAAR